MLDRMTAVILSSAEYDLYSTLGLEHELATLAPGHNIVDFRNVRYLDSTALAVLIRTLKRLREQDRGSTLALVNVAPLVRKIFEITHLDTVFQM